eukprot:CAMPEP_0172371840 /NCGR_PEP_ID=MMETSP1060-20121228/45089_1 /TAXON_ID=37318 /ORGANISM="Pseudo-nitzschia pungens, Strain cf. cingulata" /LENGTH=225 /DNA_ID=CAMNT_0013097597 /DNA_START=73 /DNA_END=750 /DNA_ORIENTATION=+
MMNLLLRAIWLSQLLCAFSIEAFVSYPPGKFDATRALRSTAAEEETTSVAVPSDLDPKEVVKIFGRLAEKYIMLDESGGMCCYSACKDCEFRLPGGGYRMADQSASRPKWIPIYEERVFEGQGKEHTSKWRTGIFEESGSTVVTKDEFIAAVLGLEFATPLGGPFVSKSAGKLKETETTVAGCLFDVLANGKDKLTRHRMSLSLKDLSGGEAGVTWAMFSAAMGL